MQNVSEEFKTAIKGPSPEFESRIIFPYLVLDDYEVVSINLDSLLAGSGDFEIGTAPMDMAKIELIEDTGDEWGRNLVLKSGVESTFVDSIPTTAEGDFEVAGRFKLSRYAGFKWRDLL